MGLNIQRSLATHCLFKLKMHRVKYKRAPCVAIASSSSSTFLESVAQTMAELWPFPFFPKFQVFQGVPKIRIFAGILGGSLYLLSCKIWSLQLKKWPSYGHFLAFPKIEKKIQGVPKIFFVGIPAGSLDLLPCKIWSLQLKKWPSYGHFLDFPKFESLQLKK